MIKKGKCEGGKVFLAEENIEISDCIIFGNGADSQGIIISQEDIWYYIPLQANNWIELMDNIIDGLNQIATSVSSAQTTAPGSPISTTITADLQPIIQNLEELKNNLV